MIKTKFLISIFVLLVLSLNFVSAGWFSPPRPSPPDFSAPYSNHPGFIPNNFNNPELNPPYSTYLSFIYDDFNSPRTRFDYFYPNPPLPPPKLGPGYIRNFW